MFRSSPGKFKRRWVLKVVVEYFQRSPGVVDVVLETDTSMNVKFDPQSHRAFISEHHLLVPYLFQTFGLRLIFTPAPGQCPLSQTSPNSFGKDSMDDYERAESPQGSPGNSHRKPGHKKFLLPTRSGLETADGQPLLSSSLLRDPGDSLLFRATDKDVPHKLPVVGGNGSIAVGTSVEEKLIEQIRKLLGNWKLERDYDIRLIRRKPRTTPAHKQELALVSAQDEQTSPSVISATTTMTTTGAASSMGVASIPSPKSPLRRKSVPSAFKKKGSVVRFRPALLGNPSSIVSVGTGKECVETPINIVDQKYQAPLCLYRLMWPVDEKRYIQTDNLKVCRQRLIRHLSSTSNINKWFWFKDLCREFATSGRDDFKNAYFRYQLLPVTRPMKEFVLGPFFYDHRQRKSAAEAKKRKSKSKFKEKDQDKDHAKDKEDNEGDVDMEPKQMKQEPKIKNQMRTFVQQQKLRHQTQDTRQTKLPFRLLTSTTPVTTPLSSSTQVQPATPLGESEWVPESRTLSSLSSSSSASLSVSLPSTQVQMDPTPALEFPSSPPQPQPVPQTFGSAQNPDRNPNPIPNSNPPPNVNSNGNSIPTLEVEKPKPKPQRQIQKHGSPMSTYAIFSYSNEGKEIRLFYEPWQIYRLWEWSSAWCEEKKEERARAKRRKPADENSGQKAHRRSEYPNEKYNIKKVEPLLAEIHDACKTGKEDQLRSRPVPLLTKEDFLQQYPDIEFPTLCFRRGSAWEIAYFETLEDLLYN